MRGKLYAAAAGIKPRIGGGGMAQNRTLATTSEPEYSMQQVEQ